MYNEKIEALIKAALADGVLTEKEKQILFRKAEEHGIDLDEFEMVLDAKLYELQQSNTTNPQEAAPKSDKFGSVRKCPVCGAIVSSGMAACFECGYAFSDISTNSAWDKLYDKLEAVDDKFDKKKGVLGSIIGENVYSDLFSQNYKRKLPLKCKL